MLDMFLKKVTVAQTIVSRIFKNNDNCKYIIAQVM